MLRVISAIAILFLAAAAVAATGLFAGRASAAGPEEDIAVANAIVQRALTAAQAGDLATALREFKSFENRWFEIEDGVRAKSRDSYRAIEKHMTAADEALTAKPPRKDDAIASLTALKQENERFVAGQPPAEAPPTSTATATSSKPSIRALLGHLDAARASVAAGDFNAASAAWGRFEDMWLDVEGQVKTRSSSDYRKIEVDIARVSTALAKRSPEATGTLDEMRVRIEPYENAGNYKVFDATIILLREGLEALLVVVALLAFVTKSGNADKGRWIWAGALGGLAVSVVLGVAIHVMFGEAFSGSNRELMEGLTGLFAAGMLLYVSYWLHSKSSLGAWQRYISTNTTRVLATGSLLGLSLLSFLAVFREGAETVLFLLGMTGKIATADLLLGLGIGTLFLAVVGVLLIVAGIRIPMRPFFAVASVLTFYLCFKFLGTGIHGLQVAGVLPATTADFLPSNETLGLFPTWQTTIPQIALLLTGLAIAARGQISDIAVRRSQPGRTVALDT